MGLVVNLAVAPESIGLFPLHQVILVVEPPSESRIARLPMVQCQARYPYLALARPGLSILLLILRYCGRS